MHGKVGKEWNEIPYRDCLTGNTLLGQGVRSLCFGIASLQFYKIYKDGHRFLHFLSGQVFLCLFSCILKGGLLFLLFLLFILLPAFQNLADENVILIFLALFNFLERFLELLIFGNAKARSFLSS